MSARKFRKKPVIVEALYFDGSRESAEAIQHWSGGEVWQPVGWDNTLWCSTMEGLLSVKPGHFVIRGVKGEFYPCDPDVFAETYEPVEESHAPAQP